MLYLSLYIDELYYVLLLLNSLNPSYFNKKIMDLNNYLNYSKLNLSTPEIKKEYDEIDIKRFRYNLFWFQIKEFIDKMNKEFKETNLITFYNNINTVEINFKIPIKTCEELGYIARYDVENNEIEVFNEVGDTLYHELFHMASTVKNNNNLYLGFKQTIDSKYTKAIAYALNEGYTEILTKRYFPIKNSCYSYYYYFVVISKKLEVIIGRNCMETNYMNSNLPRIIETLKSFVNEEDIIKFIKNTDLIYIILYLIEKEDIVIKKVQELKIREINKFLIKTYSIKLKRMLELNLITEDILENNLESFIKDLPYKIIIKSRKLEFLTDEKVDKYLHNALKNINIKTNNKIKKLKR